MSSLSGKQRSNHTGIVRFIIMVLVFAGLIGGLNLIFVTSASAESTVVKYPIADAHVREDYADRNYGSYSTMQIDGSPAKIVYLKFDVSDINGTNVALAKLRLMVTNPSTSIQTVKLVEDSTWLEDQITFNARPALGTQLAAAAGGERDLWLEIDLTDALRIHAGGTLSIAIDSQGSDGMYINSKDSGGDWPELVIDISSGDPATPTPIPSESPTTIVPTNTPVPTFTPTPSPGDIGYVGFSFGPAPDVPTGEKPQSKLWYNDGFWWGSLFNTTSNTYQIYQLDQTTQMWFDTGVTLDDRPTSKADVLWNGTYLYVVSAGPDSSLVTDSARLYRYTYNSAAQTYSLDAGFPVVITTGGMEAIVIDQDTTGTLWVTFTQSRSVFVAHSTASDATWTAPYVLPQTGTSNLTGDDISALIAFDSQIGVMWSNQNDGAMYFATHADGANDQNWSLNPALQDPGYTDDHINLKTLQADNNGRVFASVKTSLNDLPNPDANAPLLLLLVLDANGSWGRHTVGRVADDHTRPIVLIDQENQDVYVMAMASGNIYYKSSGLSNISFPQGLGTPLLDVSSYYINNVTSTKQSLNGVTDLVVLAADDTEKVYFHNVIDLLSSGVPTSTPTPVPTNTPLPTNTPTPVPTNTPLPTNTPTPVPTNTPLPTNTPTPVPTNTPLPTNTPTPLLTNTPQPTNTPTPVPTNTPLPTYTPTPLPTNTPTLVPTNTPLPTSTNTPLPTNTPTTEPTATTPPPIQVLYPEADTYGTGYSADKNYGTRTTLQVDGSPEKSTFIRFNLSGIAGSDVSTATLRLFVVGRSKSDQEVRVVADDSWNEQDLTLNTAPSSGALMGTISNASAGEWIEIDITSFVIAEAGGQLSLSITSSGGDGLDIASREASSDWPELVVDLSSGTEGTTSMTSGMDTTIQVETMHVGDIDSGAVLLTEAWQATTTITVHDSSENAIAGALVTGRWVETGEIMTCVTDVAGQCLLGIAGLEASLQSITFVIKDLSAYDWAYKASENHDPDGDSNGTLVTIQQPGTVKSVEQTSTP